LKDEEQTRKLEAGSTAANWVTLYWRQSLATIATVTVFVTV